MRSEMTRGVVLRSGGDQAAYDKCASAKTRGQNGQDSGSRHSSETGASKQTGALWRPAFFGRNRQQKVRGSGTQELDRSCAWQNVWQEEGGFMDSVEMEREARALWSDSVWTPNVSAVLVGDGC
jgi:hypothetical protein